ncbi:MAG: patatin-like phospholipase family protein [Blastocatellia bacterium]
MDKPILPTIVRELPKIAVVLGTGGIKAMAGLALFEFFEEQKLPIDLMVGCSGGALACAMIGVGCSPTEVRELGMKKLDKNLFTKLDYGSLLGIFSSRLGSFDKTSGIIKPQRWQQGLREFFGDKKLEQLRPRTLIQTTDVDTGEGVVLTRGLVADAVYASCAFFPAFPPARIDGRYLGDGIYSAPVPVVEAIKRNMDVIIALDFKEKVRTEPKGFFSAFYRHIDNTMRTLTRSQMFLSIGMHHHEIVIVEVNFDHTINPWDVHELPAIVEAGGKAMEEHRSSILSAITGFSRPKPSAEKQPVANPDLASKAGAKEPVNDGPGIRRTVTILKSAVDAEISEPGRTDS